MFGLIGSIAKAAIKTVTLPLDIVSDIGSDTRDSKTEKKIDSIIDDVGDVFDPTTW